MNVRSFYIILPLFLTLISFSQPAKKMATTIEDADEHFSHNNYLMAIPVYRNELKKDIFNNKINLRLGICYLRTRISREEAIKYLTIYVKDPKCEEVGWLYLGQAYLLANRIDQAVSAFEKYKTLKPKDSETADRFLANCANAKKLMSTPVNVTFQNLGKDINSPDPDYYPFVSADETFLAFTSRRLEGTAGKKVEVDGYHPSDIFFAKVENGKWTKAFNPGKNINGALDEQVVGLKADGLEMYVYIDNIEKFGNLYITSRKSSTLEFPKPKMCDPIINEKIETSGCLSEDGLTMFFARKDKASETSDLYTCRKLPNGKWAMPQKLPETINTKFNEDFPYLSNDGVTLYFASEGHNSMGGYDLFKTTWNPENNTYSAPENLGYPINSTDDDRNICVTPDNRVAYISTFRPGGQGDLDLYRLKFDDNEQITKIYSGKVFYGDSIPENQPKDIPTQIVVTNKKTNVEFQFVPSSRTNKFVLSLPAGKYNILVIADGYQDYTESITVTDVGSVEIERNKNFLLLKK